MIPGDCQIREYSDLIATLVARRHELGLSQGDVDYLSGLQEGYTGKIESWRHANSGRTLGRISTPLLLAALKVNLVLVTEDGEILRRKHGRRLGQGDHEPAWPSPGMIFKQRRRSASACAL